LALFGGAAGLALLAPAASAQVFQYNPQDLLFGVRSTGPNDFVVDLGPASFFTTAGAGTYNVGNSKYTSSQLSSAFSSLDNLSMSLFGDVRTSGGSLPLNTLWVTSARGVNSPSINTQTTPWASRSQSNLGTTDAKVDSIASTAVNNSPNNGINSPTAVVFPNSTAFSYTANIGSGGNFGGSFQGNVEGATGTGFASGAVPVRLDLYQMQPNTASQFVGFFDFNPNGTLTFTVVPEPSAWAVIGGGACLLFAALQRRHLQRGFGLKGDAPSLRA